MEYQNDTQATAVLAPNVPHETFPGQESSQEQAPPVIQAYPIEKVERSIKEIDAAIERARGYTIGWTKYAQMYIGTKMPELKAPISGDITPVNINELHANTEMSLASIGFKAPRFHIRADQNHFYIINRQNQEDELAETFTPEVLTYMESAGLHTYTVTEVDQFSGQPVPVTYNILDGANGARLLEACVNKWASEIDLESEVNLVNADAFLAGLGAGWMQYEDDIFFPNSKVGGEVVFKRIDLKKDLMFDPFCRNPARIHKDARWVAIRISKTKEEWQDLNDANPGFFDPQAFKLMLEHGIQETRSVRNGPHQDDGNEHSFYKEPTHENKIALKEMNIVCWLRWEKPSAVDRKMGGEFKYGKRVLLCKGCTYPIAVMPWDAKMDGFPVEFLFYNAALESGFPVSDPHIYEGLLAEKNYMRGVERRTAEFNSWMKVFGDFGTQEFADEIKKGGSCVKHVPGFDRTKIMQLILGNGQGKASEYGNKIDQDLQKSSLHADSEKGLVPETRISATGIADYSRNQMTRTAYRVNILGNFYKRIGRKFIQIAQQKYTRSRMVLISGDPNPEWTERFNRDAIQGEYSTSVDVMSMNPIDEITQRQNMTDLFNLEIGMFKDPNVHLKLISEGREPNLSETFREILRRNNVMTDKIFPKVPENLKDAASITMMTNLGVIPLAPIPGVNPADPNASQGSPSPTPAADASLMGELSTNVSPGAGMPLNPGSEMPPGGIPK